jgi:predicted ATPase
VTSLVGRAAEVATVTALLGQEEVRLLTLTGPGGVGKTRLALHVAHELQGTFADGVWLVSLAPVRDAALVPEAIGRTLGIPETGGEPLLVRLKAALRTRTLLLVIDNFEHVVAASGLLSELLGACPRLKLLATSRRRLNLYGEWEVAVPALPLPPDTATLTAAQALASEAVQLFVQRAQAAQHAFVLADAEAPAVGAICRQLDGLPLAIELAAAQVRRWTPQALLAQLAPALPLLTGGPRDFPDRHQSMRAAIAWSDALLTPAQQALLRRLGVFVGGWTADGALAVCGLGAAQLPTLLDTLGALCDHQLVQMEPIPDGVPRFAMLEMVREYALEQLGQLPGGELQAAQRRHAAYVCVLAERADPPLRGPEQLEWLARLNQEHPNMRAALGWCFGPEGAPELGVRLAGALSWFWWLQGRGTEGTGWLLRATASGEAVALAARPKLLSSLSLLAVLTTAFPQGARWAAEAQALALTQGDTRTAAWASALCGMHHLYQGNAAHGLPLLVAGLRQSQALADPWLTSTIYWNLAVSDLEMAHALLPLAEALQLAEAVGDRWSIIGMRFVTSRKHLVEGDLAGAATLLEAAITEASAIGDRRMLGMARGNLGGVLATQGALGRAVEQYTNAVMLGREIGDSHTVGDALYKLGQVRTLQGDSRAAYKAYMEGLDWARSSNDRQVIGFCLAGLAALQPSPRVAVQILSAAFPYVASLARYSDHSLPQEYNRTLAHVQARLDPASFAAAWQEGQALTLEQAIDLVLSQTQVGMPHLGPAVLEA